MKINVKVSTGGGSPFGQNATKSEVSIEAPDYEMGQATAGVLALLESLGVGQTSIDLQQDDETTVAEEVKGSDEESGWPLAKPGDAVRLTFDDGSSRLFIDTGGDYQSPHVRDIFPDPMTVAYGDKSIAHVQGVATLGGTQKGMTDGR